MRKDGGSDEPLVSVIVNCYNGERYLCKALESVFAQSYQNWELIFWDNQSTDGSAEVFKSYHDVRLKYYYAPAHTPLYKARGHAVAKASGSFIAFLDVDDWWDSEKLGRQVELFRDPEVGLVYGNYYWVDERREKTTIRYKNALPRGYVLREILRHYSVGLLTIVVRREAVEQMTPFFNPAYDIIGDFDMVVRLAAEWKLDCVQEPIAYCRWHGDNMQIKKAAALTSELESWVGEIQCNKAVWEVFPVDYYKALLDRRKVVALLASGERLNAFAYVNSMRSLKKKILLWGLCLIPQFFVRQRYG